MHLVIITAAGTARPLYRSHEPSLLLAEISQKRLFRRLGRATSARADTKGPWSFLGKELRRQSEAGAIHSELLPYVAILRACSHSSTLLD
jgi:hypothetical protein